MEIHNKERSSDELIERRKEKFLQLFKSKQLWVVAFLIIAIILGVYIRYQPLADHGGKPGLWDYTTNDYTLGPDLDPWLFTRYAGEMIAGNFNKMDMMRYLPLGFDTSTELQMVSYFIVLTYKMLNMFGTASVNYSAAFMPVWVFALTIVFFFLFVREIFLKKNAEDKNLKANIIASISTLFMIVTPIFLSRTIAGIPEKESVGFMFMFLAFYLFIKAWKTENLWFSVGIGLLSGIATALMGLSWGGVTYVYFTISGAASIAFLLNKFKKKEAFILGSWIISALLVTLMFTNRFSIKGFVTGLDTGLAFFILFVALVDFILWELKFKIHYIHNIKLPRNILSIIVAIFLVIVGISILMGPSFILEKIQNVNEMLFNPVTGRWKVTVAENREPYFTEWAGSFGPYIANIPIMFWMFFIGSIVLFRNLLKNIDKKRTWILTSSYTLFLFGLIFSRYAAHPALLDGEGWLSRFFYLGSALLLASGLIYYFIKDHKEGNHGFEKIDFSYILLFVLFILCLVTARSAVRLIMVLGPIAPIFASYLVVKSSFSFKKASDDTLKLVLGIFIALLIISSLFTFYSYYTNVKSQAYSFIPGAYNQQWQNAMSWVRESTPENSVFAHWWDYGYWVQSIGNRATVTDGGNQYVWWNYLTGRYVLTGDNQKDALDLLKMHNATHLLIDSSDIGKYTAFSSIGSNGTKEVCDISSQCDRYSWIPIMLSDQKNIQETANGTLRIYQGGTNLDEDILYNDNGTSIFLPAYSAGIAGFILELNQINEGNSSKIEFKQPLGVFVYNGQQIRLPLRYLEYEGRFIDFKTGINSTVKIIPRLYDAGTGLQIDYLGAGMYLSPRIMRGLLGQKYLLNDPFNNFPNFKLVHSEQNLFIESINSQIQGSKLGDFVYYGDVQGPIKIWQIQYTGNEKFKQEYIDTDSSKYVSFQF